MARSGLRMMPTFPSPSLECRTVGFPQYGYKAGLSDGAFRATHRGAVSRGLRSSFVPSAAIVGFLVLCRGTMRVWAPPFKRLSPLYPRGPRSNPALLSRSSTL